MYPILYNIGLNAYILKLVSLCNLYDNESIVIC